MNNKIILGHPFAGSLYKFFEQQLSDYPHTEPILHPYYRSLFGHDYDDWNDLTFALFAIFDEIIIPPADADVPDTKKYYKDKIYNNKKLGIYFSWDDCFTDEIHEQVKKDLENSFIANILKKYSPEEQEGILEYVRLYIKLSQKYNCPVLCGGTYHELLVYLINQSHLSELNTIAKNDTVLFTHNYLKLDIASFNISSLDTLYELKSDKEIKKYAKNYLKIISKYGNSIKTEAAMKDLLKSSLNINSFYERTSSILNTSSIVCSVLGFIPSIGTAFSASSLVKTALSSKAKNNKYNWYQLFYQIDKIDKDTKIKLL